MSEHLTFSVGDELPPSALLLSADSGPVLDAMMAAGFGMVSITGNDGMVIDQRGTRDNVMSEAGLLRRPLMHEGETVAVLEALPSRTMAEASRPILVDMAQAALHSIMRAAARRLLTSELHTTVVNQSYEELLAANEDLRRSESRYRALADSLEQQVAGRTAELKQATVRMLKQDKQAAIGQLAAGIAHEVNNPIGFVLSNLRSLERYMKVIGSLLAEYRDSSPENRQRMKDRKLDFILDDIPLLLRQSIAGGERIQAIVVALKSFSHIDEVEMRDIDINAELDTVLAVLQHEITARSAVINRSDLSRLTVSGNGAHIAQTFLNILMNALQSRPSGVRISITARRAGAWAEIAFADNGSGIAPGIEQRVFEPFFTTKDIGVGIGLGLSVAYNVVTSHGGTIELSMTPGGGTTVTVRLPAAGV